MEKTNNQIHEFEDHQRPHQVNRFRDQYVKHDLLTQIRLLGFLAQTKDYQWNQLGESIFEGSREQFESEFPVLHLGNIRIAAISKMIKAT